MKITIVGYYGKADDQPCGQTVKVRTLYEAMVQYAPEVKVEIADTRFLSSNPLRMVWLLLKCILTSDKIIFLPAHRGRLYMFAFFYYAKKLLHLDIYHDCIAGSLDKELEKHSNWKKYLNSFVVNWMENPLQVERLREQGITNAHYLPNFKFLKPLSKNESKAFSHEQYPLRFCTFSRVEPKKGIEDALRAMRYVNDVIPHTAVLDVYGPIQQGEKEWFEGLLREYANELNYKGFVAPNTSVNTLAPYFAMLFPTQYYTEGMPGTIVDAMFAGVPVVSRRWKWCDNMITSGYNGIVYDFEKPEALNEILLEICRNPKTITDMKRNCLIEAEKYAVEPNIRKILQTMNLR